MASKTKMISRKTEPKLSSVAGLVKRRSSVTKTKTKVSAPVNLPVIEEVTIGTIDGPVIPVSGPILQVAERLIENEPRIYPNTTPIQIEIKSDSSILRSARSGFYLGVIVGVISMSLLVIIAYISFLTSLVYRV